MRTLIERLSKSQGASIDKLSQPRHCGGQNVLLSLMATTITSRSLQSVYKERRDNALCTFILFQSSLAAVLRQAFYPAQCSVFCRSPSLIQLSSIYVNAIYTFIREEEYHTPTQA